MHYKAGNSLHTEKYISGSFQIKRNMIVARIILLIMNPSDVHLVHNYKEICHHDHIPFNMKGIINLFLLPRPRMRGGCNDCAPRPRVSVVARPRF